MFEANPYSQDAVRHFRRFLNLAAAGDMDLLQDMAAWWWRAETTGEKL
jgi:prephenate dehydrogenase